MNIARLLKQRFEQGAWQRRSGPLAAVIDAGAVVLLVFYLTVSDGRSLLDFLNRSTEIGLIAEMRVLLNLEITVAVIELVLDVYLLLVSLTIFAQGLRHFSGSRVRTVENWEFAARLFLTGSAEGLRTGLIGLGLVRLMVGFFQRGLRLEPEEAPALLISGIGPSAG